MHKRENAIGNIFTKRMKEEYVQCSEFSALYSKSRNAFIYRCSIMGRKRKGVLKKEENKKSEHRGKTHKSQ